MNQATKLSTLAIGLTALGLTACGGGDDAQVTPPPPLAAPQFAFNTTPADSPLYTRVDRTGVPALATAVLSNNPNVTITGVSGAVLNPAISTNAFNDQRDQLNRGDPANDARDFAATIVDGPQNNSLKNIHFKLNAELRALGLTPCSTVPAGATFTKAEVNVDACVAQAAPVLLPDVITYDFAAPAGFPNGRTFDDPVVDRLLAAALLKLTPTGATPAPHNINTLVGVIDTWNGPTGQACPAPCRNTGDETNTASPATFPYLRPAYP